MSAALPDADILLLEQALDAVERDARALVAGLDEELGTRSPGEGAWSVSECFDHLAVTNRVYLAAMWPAAERAAARGRLRRAPVRPGLIGTWFVRSLEPPGNALFGNKAPAIIRPRSSPAVRDAFDAFLASQEEVRAFMLSFAAIDLGSVRFPNPFVRGVRFSLATGLHAIAAHERRHLWQAWRARRAVECINLVDVRRLPAPTPER
ncbi:MAG: DinB family protein [Thermoanaerobaculia bacterium]